MCIEVPVYFENVQSAHDFCCCSPPNEPLTRGDGVGKLKRHQPESHPPLKLEARRAKRASPLSSFHRTHLAPLAGCPETPWHALCFSRQLSYFPVKTLGMGWAHPPLASHCCQRPSAESSPSLSISLVCLRTGPAASPVEGTVWASRWDERERE